MIIPIPTKEETHSAVHKSSAEKDRWVAWYLNCPDWKCDECGAVMFGRCKECVYCRIRLYKHTPRPISYVELPYEQNV